MFQLQILTPEAVFSEHKVRSIILPGIMGYFEVLKHHAPIIAGLKNGRITVDEGKHVKKVYVISGGVLKVSKDKVSLLVEEIRERVRDKGT